MLCTNNLKLFEKVPKKFQSGKPTFLILNSKEDKYQIVVVALSFITKITVLLWGSSKFMDFQRFKLLFFIASQFSFQMLANRIV